CDCSPINVRDREYASGVQITAFDRKRIYSGVHPSATAGAQRTPDAAGRINLGYIANWNCCPANIRELELPPDIQITANDRQRKDGVVHPIAAAGPQRTPGAAGGINLGYMAG